MSRITARPMQPFGVEVAGLDAAAPPAPDVAGELRALFAEHRLLVVRGQELTADDQVRLCAALAPVHDSVGHLSNTEVPGYHPPFRLVFHSDFAFTEHPLLGISLYAEEVAPGAVATRFVDTHLALGRLSAGLLDRIEGREVVMVANTVDAREDVAARTVPLGDDAPHRTHIRRTAPIVGRHRVSGLAHVVANEQHAHHVVGVSEQESDALLDDLFAELYDAAAVYEHQWAPRDLVVWDNVVLQHGRAPNADTVRRCLRRVTMNDRPMREVLAGTVYEAAFTPS